MPRFITKKWTEVHDQSIEPYHINKFMRLVIHILLKELLLLKEQRIEISTIQILF